MNLTIPYTSKRLRNTLLLSLLYWAICLMNILGADNFGYLQIGFLILAILSTLAYFRERKKQYLTISEGMIKRNDIWGKKIRLDEVVHIEKYAGDYILKTPTKKLRIDTHIILPEALEELEEVLNQIQLTAAKT